MRHILRIPISMRPRRPWSTLFLAAMPVILAMPSHGAPADAEGDAAPATDPTTVTADPATVTVDPAPTASPSSDLQELLSGQGFPLTFKLRDLNGEWRRLTIGSQLDYASLMSGAGANAYYTRGQTVTVAGETYLVAYHAEGKPIDLAAIMRAGSGGEPPVPEKITPDTTVSLTLLNLKTSGSLRDIRPFNLQQEIGGSAKLGAATMAGRMAETNSASLSQLKQLSLGLLMYTQDYDEVLPAMKDAATIKKPLMPYVKSGQVFISPITKEPYRPNPVLSGKKLAHITNPASIVAFYEPGPAPDGTRGVAFLDGHAKRIKEAEWPQVKRASKIP